MTNVESTSHLGHEPAAPDNSLRKGGPGLARLGLLILTSCSFSNRHR